MNTALLSQIRICFHIEHDYISTTTYSYHVTAGARRFQRRQQAPIEAHDLTRGSRRRRRLVPRERATNHGSPLLACALATAFRPPSRRWCACFLLPLRWECPLPRTHKRGKHPGQNLLREGGREGGGRRPSSSRVLEGNNKAQGHSAPPAKPPRPLQGVEDKRGLPASNNSLASPQRWHRRLNKSTSPTKLAPSLSLSLSLRPSRPPFLGAAAASEAVAEASHRSVAWRNAVGGRRGGRAGRHPPPRFLPSPSYSSSSLCLETIATEGGGGR